MALEAVVFPQGFLSYAPMEMYTSRRGPWGREATGLVEEGGAQGFYGSWDSSCFSVGMEWDANFPVVSAQEEEKAAAVAANGGRKRRRTRSLKDKEAIESQRLTHIFVERNRRKQMNDHLAVLRSLMPIPYVQKGDQASIIGGAINFVKELEQLLQCLEVHKHLKQKGENGGQDAVPSTTPLSTFFSFPQHSATTTARATDSSSVGSVEVRLVENHANLKVLSERRPRQLLKLVIGLQGLGLTILHLNVTTFHPMALYSFNLKVEEGTHLASVEGIAASVHQMLERVQEEAVLHLS